MKYIDEDKLKERVTRLIASTRQNDWPLAEDYLRRVIDIIDSLQQEQTIQVNTLTWRDINDLERIINNVHYEFRNGIGEKSFGEEVLERFREERDEQEQPEVDLEKELDQWRHKHFKGKRDGIYCGEYLERESQLDLARHFWNKGYNARKKE